MHVVAASRNGDGSTGISLKSWLGTHWEAQRQIYSSSVAFGQHRVQGPPAIASWGRPRLDIFFASTDRLGRPNITHLWRAGTARDPFQEEHLPFPPIALS